MEKLFKVDSVAYIRIKNTVDLAVDLRRCIATTYTVSTPYLKEQTWSYLNEFTLRPLDTFPSLFLYTVWGKGSWDQKNLNLRFSFLDVSPNTLCSTTSNSLQPHSGSLCNYWADLFFFTHFVNSPPTFPADFSVFPTLLTNFFLHSLD